MILDTSVLIAILRDEPDAPKFTEAIERAPTRRLSAANYLEAAIVIDANSDAVLSRRFDELVARAAVRIEPVTEAQARIAREAYRDFGKGSGHSAQLDFGDCFAYALARTTDETLLFKGRDFAATRCEVRPRGPGQYRVGGTITKHPFLSTRARTTVVQGSEAAIPRRNAIR